LVFAFLWRTVEVAGTANMGLADIMRDPVRKVADFVNDMAMGLVDNFAGLFANNSA